jgi:hypothetical protein
VEGVMPNTQVVTAGQLKLRNGTPVEVIDPGPTPAADKEGNSQAAPAVGKDGKNESPPAPKKDRKDGPAPAKKDGT